VLEIVSAIGLVAAYKLRQGDAVDLEILETPVSSTQQAYRAD
jgi:hypothetical protein